MNETPSPLRPSFQQLYTSPTSSLYTLLYTNPISAVQPQPRDFEIRLIRERERPDARTRHYWTHLGSNPSTYFSWWVSTQPLCVCDLAQKLSKVSAPPESPRARALIAVLDSSTCILSPFRDFTLLFLPEIPHLISATFNPPLP